MNLKKRISYLLMIATAAALTTGCLADNTASGTPEASGRAVEGSEAMEEKEEDTRKELRWDGNSDNRYEVDDWKGTLIQYSLDGTRIKSIKMGSGKADEELEWVTDQWIYYTTVNKIYDDVLWRIPVRKTEKGDRILLEKKEKIFTTPADLSICYADDAYLILDLDDDGEEDTGLYRYDLTDKKVEKILGDRYLSVLETEFYPLLSEEGELFIESMDKEDMTRLSRLDPDTGKLHHISAYGSKGYCGSDDWIQMGDFLWILIDTTLYQYNSQNDEMECVVPYKGFQAEVKKLKSGRKIKGELDDIFLDDIFLENGRMYFPVWIQWMDKDSQYTKEELFSAPIHDLSRLRHENEIMESLEEEGKEMYVKYQYSPDKAGTSLWYCYHTGCICDFRDGKIYYEYEKEKKKEAESRYIIYDLHTGEKKDVKWKELSKKERNVFSD